MKTISATFTRAASGMTIATGPKTTAYWLIIFALVILDDGEHHEQERRRQTEIARQPKPPVLTP